MIMPPLDWEKVASQVVTAAIGEVAAGSGDVPIRSDVVKGHAARSLLAASAGADLLVIGTRGHSGFVEALLGSTAQHCAQHATCPVVVIRAAGSPDGPLPGGDLRAASRWPRSLPLHKPWRQPGR
jgi:nucleotide-binding universal stress UspA family protein